MRDAAFQCQDACLKLLTAHAQWLWEEENRRRSEMAAKGGGAVAAGLGGMDGSGSGSGSGGGGGMLASATSSVAAWGGSLFSSSVGSSISSSTGAAPPSPPPPPPPPGKPPVNLVGGSSGQPRPVVGARGGSDDDTFFDSLSGPPAAGHRKTPSISSAADGWDADLEEDGVGGRWGWGWGQPPVGLGDGREPGRGKRAARLPKGVVGLGLLQGGVAAPADGVARGDEARVVGLRHVDARAGQARDGRRPAEHARGHPDPHSARPAARLLGRRPLDGRLRLRLHPFLGLILGSSRGSRAAKAPGLRVCGRREAQSSAGKEVKRQQSVRLGRFLISGGGGGGAAGVCRCKTKIMLLSSCEDRLCVMWLACLCVVKPDRPRLLLGNINQPIKQTKVNA